YQVTRGENEPGRADGTTPRVSRYLHEVLEIVAGDRASWYINKDHQILVSGSFSTDRVNRVNGSDQYSTVEIVSTVRPTYFTIDQLNPQATVAASMAGNDNKPAAQNTYTITDAKGRPEKVYAFDTGANNLGFVTGTYADGESAVWMMGVNTNGQLGRAYTNGLNTPLSDADRAEINIDQPTQVYAPFEDQPVDSRSLVTLPNVVDVTIGDNHSVFYQQGGSVLDVGLGTSGQLGDNTTVSKNLPVVVGSGDTTSAKVTAATVKDGSTVVASYTVAPDFVSMGLTQEFHIDVKALKIQLSDGFNLYKDGYRIDPPAGATVTFTSGDDSIGMFLEGGNKVSSVTRTAGTAGEAVLVSADGAKTGVVTVYITITGNGTTVMGQIRVAITNTQTKRTEAMVSAGLNHSAALAEDGTIWLWGSNANGQLGTGTVNVPTFYEYPYHLQISDGDSQVYFTSVKAGDGYTLALEKDTGALWAWGKGYTATPAKAEGSYTQIEVYENRVIGLGTDGKVYTWTSTATTPVEVSLENLKNGETVKQVAVGENHYMLLTDIGNGTGKVYTWGQNTYGQLGMAGGVNKDVSVNLVQVNEAGTALTTVRENKNLLTVNTDTVSIPTAVARDNYTVTDTLILASGTVGVTEGSNRAVYRTVKVVEDVLTKDVYDEETVTGTAWNNLSARNKEILTHATHAGLNANIPDDQPIYDTEDSTKIIGCKRIKRTWYAVSNPASVTLRADDLPVYEERTVTVDGEETTEQVLVGYWRFGTKSVDADIMGASTELTGIVPIAAGANTSSAVTADGRVYIWGDNRNYEAASGDQDYVYLLNGQETHMVAKGNARDTDGNNSVIRPTLMTGNIGSGMISESYAWNAEDKEFQSVNKGTAITGVAAVDMGGNHGLLLTDNGELYAWGLNQKGQTGVGADPDMAAQIGSTGSLSNAGSASSAYYHMELPTVVAKGEAWNAGVEAGIQGITALSAGRDNTLAVRNDGFVFAWGSNDNYKLGAPTVYEDPGVTAANTRIAATPVQVGDLEARTLAVYKVTVYDKNDVSHTTPKRTYTFEDVYDPDAIAQIALQEDEVAVIDYHNNATDTVLVETYLSGFNLKVNSRSLAVRAADITGGNIQWTSADPTTATVAAENNVATSSPVPGNYGTTLVRVPNHKSGHTGTI
ncbi:MAG: hypothetical protein K2F83_04545, partial [Oscillospiraceae bacterium]|nr:hypothetical protein [Oscillospiraceae bacterium]